MNTIFNIILPLPEGKITIRIKIKAFFNLGPVRSSEKGNVQQKRWEGNREGKTKKQNNNNNNEK